MLTVLGLGLLNMSKGNVQIAGGYQLSEQAFFVAEAGLENVGRNEITTYYSAINALFFDKGNLTKLPDKDFNDFDDLFKSTGAYTVYYSHFPGFRDSVTIDSDNNIKGYYFVRIIDNDNMVLKSAYEYSNESSGVVTNRREDEDGDPFDKNFTANFSLDRDGSVYIQSRGIIAQVDGNGEIVKILATKLITTKTCAIEESTGAQAGESAANASLTPEFCN
jgi:hypothetical protein